SSALAQRGDSAVLAPELDKWSAPLGHLTGSLMSVERRGSACFSVSVGRACGPKVNPPSGSWYTGLLTPPQQGVCVCVCVCVCICVCVCVCVYEREREREI